VADCCDKVYPCRHCHDDLEDHRLEPRNVTQIVCMTCSLRQPISGDLACILKARQLRGHRLLIRFLETPKESDMVRCTIDHE